MLLPHQTFCSISTILVTYTAYSILIGRRISILLYTTYILRILKNQVFWYFFVRLIFQKTEYSIVYKVLIYYHISMSDVDVLEMEIQNMKNDISEIKEDLKEIKNMFNKLDDRYPTRREFKTVVSVIWFVATVLWVIATILSLSK